MIRPGEISIPLDVLLAIAIAVQVLTIALVIAVFIPRGRRRNPKPITRKRHALRTITYL